MIRLIKLPGIRELEDRLVMDTHAADKALERFQRECDRTLKNLFGISRADTLVAVPATVDIQALSEDECEDLHWQTVEHEEQFQSEKIGFDEDKVEYLKTLGWDLTNERGHPLGITRHVCRVVEAVAKGIAGKVPEADVIDIKRLENNLQLEVDKFKRRKREERR